MHWFWFNENKDNPPGWRRWPWHGRAFLHMHDSGRSEFSIEWAPSLSPRLSLRLGGEMVLTFSVWLLGITLYFGATTPWLARRLERFTAWDADRELVVYWYEGGLWWNLWRTRDSWTTGTPWWRHGHFAPLDWMFGQNMRQHKEHYSTHAVEIPMPEGAYPATVTITRTGWGRKRLPFRTWMWHADVEPKTPVPFPGKGENSWDCGEDATHSLHCSIDRPDPALAVGEFVASVMRDRMRHGGNGWRPLATTKSGSAA